ncbi:hypothetical protein [Paraburkholderia aromaticivorans]|uniref:hypothetical protein n=1 Tax=Paraburkholderia aromaticivorans TaxID=2026199 RepID=UPI001455F042|nr:hypothetical protein [Paraburkholderia aromaticivorans]
MSARAALLLERRADTRSRPAAQGAPGIFVIEIKQTTSANATIFQPPRWRFALKSLADGGSDRVRRRRAKSDSFGDNARLAMQHNHRLQSGHLAGRIAHD